jgi:hypothetical protein
MLLCYYMFRPYKAIFRQQFFKDSNSLYAIHLVFLKYVVDVPSHFLNCGCFYVILDVLFFVVRIIYIIGTSGEFVGTRMWTFGFHKVRENFVIG